MKDVGRQGPARHAAPGLSALALLLASGCAAATALSDTRPAIVRIDPPRDTAHHMGDVVRYRALIVVPQGWALDRDGVAGAGVEGRPIELRGYQLAPPGAEGGCARCQWLSLDWQIFKGLRDAEDLKTAPTRVRWRRGAQTTLLTLPPAVLAVSPLINWDLRPNWLDSMRPGWLARPVDVASRLGEAGAGLAVAALAASGWLWSTGRWLPRRGRRPFAEALQALRARHRGRGRGSVDADIEDLRRWHRAFDASAGETVFTSTLDAYFAERPGHAPHAAETRAMFANSRAVCFLDPAQSTRVPVRDLVSLVQRLAQAEFAAHRSGSTSGTRRA